VLVAAGSRLTSCSSLHAQGLGGIGYLGMNSLYSGAFEEVDVCAACGGGGSPWVGVSLSRITSNAHRTRVRIPLHFLRVNMTLWRCLSPWYAWYTDLFVKPSCCCPLPSSVHSTVKGGERAIMFNRIVGVRDIIKSEGTYLMWPWFDKPIFFDIR
jgi:hypothetical protein